MVQLNLIGIIFQISEGALQKMKAYRLGLYRYFAPKPDGEEILADLEHHIAEIFWETTKANTIPIQENLVEAMIKRVGNVADFEAAEQNPAYSLSFEEELYQPVTRTVAKTALPTRSPIVFAPYAEDVWGLPTRTAENNPEKYQSIHHKRLYRDSKRAMLGGVAAGFAHYFQIDVVWIRVLFLATFLGLIPTPFATGTVVLIYLLLWAALPHRGDLPEIEVSERLYRDLRDRQIGGVCAGLALYFKWKKRDVRLVFSLTAFLGIGIMLYVMLWAIMPKKNGMDNMDSFRN